MSFKEYETMCPNCGSWRIQGEGARYEGYLWHCIDCKRESYSKTVFKKTRVMNMKRWKNWKGLLPYQIKSGLTYKDCLHSKDMRSKK